MTSLKGKLSDSNVYRCRMARTRRHVAIADNSHRQEFSCNHTLIAACSCKLKHVHASCSGFVQTFHVSSFGLEVGWSVNWRVSIVPCQAGEHERKVYRHHELFYLVLDRRMCVFVFKMGNAIVFCLYLSILCIITNGMGNS
jgi:hypothetical protein